jgi:chromosome segregation ATPase
MSEIAEIIDTLESRINKLLSNKATLENENLILKTEVIHYVSKIQEQSNEVEVLKKQYSALKMASSILGSDENKKETKLKINSLIREIDYCIAQLSD